MLKPLLHFRRRTQVKNSYTCREEGIQAVAPVAKKTSKIYPHTGLRSPIDATTAFVMTIHSAEIDRFLE
jgi:hypothetical protein